MDIQNGLFWLILTIFLEARDQTPQGQKNIVKVILNRAEKKQCHIYDVVFREKQFSCYNEGLTKAFESVVKEVKQISAVTTNVLRAIDEWEEGDNLDGATLYFNPKLVPGGWPASWKKERTKFVMKEQDHIFLIEV